MAYELSNISDHIMTLKIIGDFDADDALVYADDLEEYFERAKSVGRKLHIYVDTSEMGKISVEIRRVTSETNKDPRAGYVATDGVNRVIRIMARFLMVASGRNNIYFFDTQKEAIDWLKSLEE